jgi:Ca2+-transporting ATPase
MGGGGFALFWWLLESGRPVDEARNLLLLLFVLFENIQTFNSRSERHSVFATRLSSNPLLIAGVAGAQALHILAMHLPVLRETLVLEPVSPLEWILLALLGCSILLVMEFDKWRNPGGAKTPFG